MTQERSIFLNMPWHSTISENGWEADIWAGDSSAHIATISISEKSREDVAQIAGEIIALHNAVSPSLRALQRRVDPPSNAEFRTEYEIGLDHGWNECLAALAARTPSPVSPTRSDTREQAAASPAAVAEEAQDFADSLRCYCKGYRLNHEDAMLLHRAADFLAALSSQAPKPVSAGGEIWTVIDEARRIALASDDGMDMKHCSHLINAIKAYDASGCGPILNVAAEADTAKDGSK